MNALTECTVYSCTCRATFRRALSGRRALCHANAPSTRSWCRSTTPPSAPPAAAAAKVQGRRRWRSRRRTSRSSRRIARHVTATATATYTCRCRDRVATAAREHLQPAVSATFSVIAFAIGHARFVLFRFVSFRLVSLLSPVHYSGSVFQLVASSSWPSRAFSFAMGCFQPVPLHDLDAYMYSSM